MISHLASVFPFALGGCRVIRPSADASAPHGAARLAAGEIGNYPFNDAYAVSCFWSWAGDCYTGAHN
jgi:hypothetical protein